MNHKIAHSKRDKYIDEFGSINGNVFTPEEAILPLLPYLDRSWRIWDCAYGTGRLAEHFKKHHYTVVGGSSVNFLTQTVDSEIIVTNPPYSFKDEFLKRAFELGRPFAFLLPLTGLEGQKRSKMFREHGIQLIVPDKRINFEIPSGKKSAWFATAWFCYGLRLPSDLMFVELERIE